MGWDTISSIVARLLASYPVQSIILSLLLIAALSCGLKNLHLEQDIRKSFSPEDSDAGYEARVWLKYHNLSTFPERVFCMFTADEHQNLLSKEALAEISRVDEQLSSAVDVVNSDGRRNCHPLCDLNRPFQMFLNETALKSAKNISNAVKYPDFVYNGAEIFLGLHLSNIDYSQIDQKLHSRTLVLWYFSRAEVPEGNQLFKDTVNRLFEQSKNVSSFEHLKFTIFSDMVANREMIRGAIDATTLMTIGFFLLLTQVIIVVARLSSCRTAPVLVASSILIPIISTVASFGTICWFGLPTFSIQCVTPFLVLGIGVDDAFILLHRWKHYSSTADMKTRLEQVIVDVGPSITITSVTNIIAFGIGFLTPTPQMSLFCLTASIALFYDYALTYTVFAPIVFICNDSSYTPVQKPERSSTSWLAKYSRFICTLNGRLLCGFVLILMYGLTTYGVLTMRTTFEPSKAFPSNSKLVTALDNIKPVFNQNFPITIIVNNPPDIEDAEQYKAFYSMISELEEIPGIRKNRTLLFLKPYEKFDKEVSELVSFFFGEYSPSYGRLPYWLEQIGNPPFVKLAPDGDQNSTEVEAFRFTLLGEGMSEWAERARAMHHVRTILTNDRNFNATVFDYDSAILNIITSVGQDLVGSIAVTVVCMALVCIIFIPNINAVAAITSIIASICYVLVGGLSWWRADLDPVIQVDVLLATGFSVDYTAHVAYNFFRSRGSPAERVFCSLSEMAEPMFEAGLSTFLCMLPLIFVPTYAIVCFAKTVFLVVAIGLLHGLFILPVVLSLFARENPAITENNNNNISSQKNCINLESGSNSNQPLVEKCDDISN